MIISVCLLPILRKMEMKVRIIIIGRAADALKFKQEPTRERDSLSSRRQHVHVYIIKGHMALFASSSHQV